MHVVNKEDWIVIISFMASFICLYGSAIFIIGRAILTPGESRPKLGFAGLLVLLTSTATIACIWYAYFIEPNDLEITDVTLPIHGLKNPFVAVQVSDTHSGSTVRLEKRVSEEIARIKPAVIFFTGDAVNSTSGQKVFNKFISELLKVAPVYGVKGDWDFAFFDRDVLADAGLPGLGEPKIVDIAGNTICVTGVELGSRFPPLNNVPKDLPTIALYHSPDADIVLNNDLERYSLYLCGHTHGGQIAFPYYGALITQSKQGKRLESGLHKIGKTWLYTNRGIGMEGHFPPLRFFARPELTVFRLVPE